MMLVVDINNVLVPSVSLHSWMVKLDADRFPATKPQKPDAQPSESDSEPESESEPEPEPSAPLAVDRRATGLRRPQMPFDGDSEPSDSESEPPRIISAPLSDGEAESEDSDNAAAYTGPVTLRSLKNPIAIVGGRLSGVTPSLVGVVEGDKVLSILLRVRMRALDLSEMPNSVETSKDEPQLLPPEYTYYVEIPHTGSRTGRKRMQ